jgi:hypothetical protein
MGRQFYLVELRIGVGEDLHGVKSLGLLCGSYFTLPTGKNLKTKKDCFQSLLCSLDTENYSGVISNVKQSGKERAMLANSVSQ